MSSWNIIGWILLAMFIGFPILATLLKFIGRVLLWFLQKDIRTTPRKYDRWQSIWGGPVYRINAVNIREAPAYDTIMVSTDPNNMGGWHERVQDWLKLVHRRKMVKVN